MDFEKLPYRRVIIPSADGESFTGFIDEFPGCIVQADSPYEAYKELEEAALDWIEAAKDLGQSIPTPFWGRTISNANIPGSVTYTMVKDNNQSSCNVAGCVICRGV